MSRRKTTEQFIADAVAVHGDRYDYSKVEYVNAKTKVCIICPEHGEFWQAPTDHKSSKRGCKKCGNFKKGISKTRGVIKDKFKGLKQPEDYKLIPLTRGKFAKVDNEDFDRVKDICWSYTNNGYSFNDSHGLMHRFIMNAPDNLDVDHIDRDKLNNRKINLRTASRQQNIWNSLPDSGSSSKYKGVSWTNDRQYWRCQISIGGGKIKTSLHKSEEEAARAYDKKAIELRGEWAYQTLNFPELLDDYLKELEAIAGA